MMMTLARRILRCLWESGEASAQHVLRAQFPQVELYLYDRSNSYSGTVWYLDTLNILDPTQRRQGLGTRVMTALCQLADDAHATVALTPTADFGSNLNRLRTFYMRFGFIPNRGRAGRNDITGALIRPASTLHESYGHRIGFMVDGVDQPVDTQHGGLGGYGEDHNDTARRLGTQGVNDAVRHRGWVRYWMRSGELNLQFNPAFPGARRDALTFLQQNYTAGDRIYFDLVDDHGGNRITTQDAFHDSLRTANALIHRFDQ